MKRILVADADQGTAKIVEQWLTEFGYFVDRSEDGHLALTRRQQFHLVIACVVLNGTNGWELTNRVHAADEDVPTPFILYSRESDEQAGFKAMRHGAAYLQQPFTKHDLIDCVRRTLGEADLPLQGRRAIGRFY